MVYSHYEILCSNEKEYSLTTYTNVMNNVKWKESNAKAYIYNNFTYKKQEKLVYVGGSQDTALPLMGIVIETRVSWVVLMLCFLNLIKIILDWNPQNKLVQTDITE